MTKMTCDVRTVVGERAHHADYKASTSHCAGTAARTVVRVLPEDTSILFMNADDILDNYSGSRLSDISTGLSTGSRSDDKTHDQ